MFFRMTQKIQVLVGQQGHLEIPFTMERWSNYIWSGRIHSVNRVYLQRVTTMVPGISTLSLLVKVFQFYVCLVTPE
ncbi:hypothetical protein V1477_009712 [Vespula maculifrons]|uniref:Uncharacterized protein n=2 Tax=Vespula TaxID=7451 RepID=A0A834K3H8_VESGE|nr:hypothetical protein HZH68_008070 [Vespula germanica]